MLGVVVGLEAEARLARRWGTPVVVGGGDAAGAARAADRLMAGDVTGLISFGLAGGLAPALQAGTLVVPRLVVDADASWPTDDRLNSLLGGGTGHVLLGGGAVLGSVAQKHVAHAAGSDAVDLESAAVARAAARHGLPFAVLRAICDTADRTLPLAALLALDGAGRIAGWRVAGAILRRPWELAALIGLGIDAARARTALSDRVRTTSLIDGLP